jgi:hypothetical protein
MSRGYKSAGGKASGDEKAPESETPSSAPFDLPPGYRQLYGLGADGGGSSTGMPGAVQAKMETAFGADFSDVRIHEGGRAGALGAVAYAQGNDIHFAPGKYDPHSQGGQELLGHELTHVVQQRTGRVEMPQGKGAPINASPSLEAEADELGARAARGEAVTVSSGAGATAAPTTAPVQAKLAGTHAVLVTQGGKGSSVIKGDWSKLLGKVKQYEKREAKGAPQDELRSLLGALIAKVEAFLDEDRHQKDDPERTQVLQTMLSRLYAERNELRQGRSGAAYTDDRLVEHQDNVAGGAINKLDSVEYKGDDGETEKGFFKEELEGTTSFLAQKSGISDTNPGFNARSVAMYRIDQLLGTHLIVPTAFATHKRQRVDEEGAPKGDPTLQPGIFMARAKGAELRSGLVDKRNVSLGDGKRAGALDLDDPTLQRCLNQLQILDVLCGQVDRHMGNVFVQQDESGKTIGVTGIDNDLAFGKDVGTEKDEEIPSFKGLPPVVDREVAKAIERLTEKDLRDALQGLIDEAEIAQTVQRLATLQKYLGSLPKDRKLKAKQWGPEARQLQGDKNSYLVALEAEVLGKRKDEFYRQVVNHLTGFGKQDCIDALLNALVDHRLMISQIERALGLMKGPVNKLSDEENAELEKIKTTPGSTAKDRLAATTELDRKYKPLIKAEIDKAIAEAGRDEQPSEKEDKDEPPSQLQPKEESHTKRGKRRHAERGQQV